MPYLTVNNLCSGCPDVPVARGLALVANETTSTLLARALATRPAFGSVTALSSALGMPTSTAPSTPVSSTIAMPDALAHGLLCVAGPIRKGA